MSRCAGVFTRVATTSLTLTTAAGLALAPVASAIASPGDAFRTALVLQPADAPPPEAAPPAGDPAAATQPPGDPAAATQPPGDPAAATQPPPGDPAEAAQPPPAEPETETTLSAPETDDDDDDDDDDGPGKGLGWLIGGGAVTAGVGVPLTWAGANIYLSDQGLGLSELVGSVFLGFGITGLCAGLAMVTVGSIKFARYRAWQRDNNVAIVPSVGRTALGTSTPGLRIRF